MTSPYVEHRVAVDDASYQDIISWLKFLEVNTEKALQIAVNKTMPPVRTLGIKRIAARRNLKVKYLRERINVAQKASVTNAGVGKISAKARGLLLNRYETRRAANHDQATAGRLPSNPPRVRTDRGGAIKKLSSKWFFLRFPNQYIGIARRLGPGRNAKIDVAYAPSASQEWFREKEAIEPEIGPIFRSRLANTANYLIRKQTPR